MGCGNEWRVGVKREAHGDHEATAQSTWTNHGAVSVAV